MSQSIFPDYWAEILAEQYAKEGHCDDEDRKRLCSLWIQRVIKYRDEQIKLGKDPWKLDNFLASRKGAGATICGVRFENATDWKGDVLGDSCIIKINTKDWIIEILTSEEKAFDSFPDFYDSYAEKPGRGTIMSFEGSISPDDILLLVSDPFSEYIANNKENAQELIGELQKIGNHKDYCKLVDDWRAKGMHNDDSTLCVIEFDGDINMNVKHQDKISILMEEEKKEEKVEISVVQNEVLLDEESSEQKIMDTIEENESKEVKTSQSGDLQVFFNIVIKELEALISRFNKRYKKDNIKKNDIMKIRERLTKEYENLATSD
jgi:phage-related protein